MSEQRSRQQLRLDALASAIDSGTLGDVRRMLNTMPAQDIAYLLESSPPRFRQILWSLVDEEDEGEVLQELDEELRLEFLRDMDAEQLVLMTEGLEPDDVADILQQLPDTVTRQVLNSMDAQDRARVEQVLTYPEDCAGGLMNTDTITIRPRLTMDVVLRYLRRHSALPHMTDNLIVVNRGDQYIGMLPVNVLLVSDPSATVREMMVTDIEPIPATLRDREVAHLFERNHWVSAPVVDENGKLLGRITIDDVVDVIREETDHSIMSLARLTEDEGTFSPILTTAPRRGLWLGVNLITASLAASVVNLFQDTIEKVVALAVLMPIVASMGGVAGTQTLTILVRGIALGQISQRNQLWLIGRELGSGALNGILWGAVIALGASLWFGDWTIGLIILMALVISLLAAATAGTLVPLLLHRLRIDPALAGGIAITTVTDVIGFFSFLGLATLFYA